MEPWREPNFSEHCLRLLVINQNLKKIKTIPSAWTYSNVYDKLLYALRNTLIDVKVNFRRMSFDRKVRWDMLRRLDKLKNFKSLTFNSYIHGIKGTENILKNCNLLEELTIHLSLDSEIENAQDIYIWMEENVKRNFTLKTLRVQIGQVYHSYLIGYPMYKYPNIEVVISEKLPIEEPWITSTLTYPIVISDISSMLEKINKVPCYQLKCTVLGDEAQNIINLLKSDSYSAINEYSISLIDWYTVLHVKPNNTQI